MRPVAVDELGPLDMVVYRPPGIFIARSELFRFVDPSSLEFVELPVETKVAENMIRLTILKNALVVLVTSSTLLSAQMLERSLLEESPDVLVAEAMKLGDATRGAILFHQGYLTCTKCHMASRGQASTRAEDKRDRSQHSEELHCRIGTCAVPSHKERVCSLLPCRLSMAKLLIGLLVDKTDDVVRLRNPASGGVDSIAASDIEEMRAVTASIMPTGLMNLLSNRQQFLDLCRYLFEVAEGGAEREAALKPPASLYALRIPDYEGDIDHAGMIGSLDDESLQRGEKIYNRLCINCHGTAEQTRLFANVTSFCEREIQERKRPVQYVSDADPWLRNDGGAIMDGATTEIRRHPLHPRRVS